MSAALTAPGEIEFDEAICAPAEFVVLLTAHDADSDKADDIQLLLKSGSGGLYVSYSAAGARGLARALIGAAEHMETQRLMHAGGLDRSAIN